MSLEMQKKVARRYLSEKRFDEALQLFLEILQADPKDPETLQAIGELYHATAIGENADWIPADQSTDPAAEPASGSIVDGSGAIYAADRHANPSPQEPGKVEETLQALSGRDQEVSEVELARAADLLAEIINSPAPAVAVSAHLNEIDSLLPALIDLNIQQARLDGRPDLASGLKDLKANIGLQKSIVNSSSQGEPTFSQQNTSEGDDFSGKVAVFVSARSAGVSAGRMEMLRKGLRSNGNLAEEDPAVGFADVAVFSNPFVDPRLMEKMVACSAADVPIILDLDHQFDQTFLIGSKGTVGGVNSQPRDRAYVSSLILADLITVSSEAFAEYLRSSGYPAMTIPNGWSMANPYWAEKPANTGATIQLGWLGNSGSLDDLAVIRRPLIRLLNEFNDKLRLVIIGNEDAYRMFDHVPGQLKTFIPAMDEDELPYVLNQVDILLHPLRKTMRNELQSDEILMYAGIKRIPWAASSYPAARDWQEGGVICATTEEWHTNLRCLFLDKTLRQNLGKTGYSHSEKRELSIHLRQWAKAFHLARSMQRS